MNMLKATVCAASLLGVIAPITADAHNNDPWWRNEHGMDKIPCSDVRDDLLERALEEGMCLDNQPVPPPQKTEERKPVPPPQSVDDPKSKLPPQQVEDHQPVPPPERAGERKPGQPPESTNDPNSKPPEQDCPKFGSFDYPFSGDSAQYRSIGSDAQYASDSDQTTQDLAKANFNVINSSNGYGFNVYNGMQSAAPPKSREGVVIQVDGNTAHEHLHYQADSHKERTWAMDGKPEPTDGGRLGFSASGVAGLFGLMRGREINSPDMPIQHVTQIVLSHVSVADKAVWPAAHTDGYCKEGACKGSVAYGSLLAIPADVDIASLDLSEPGKRVAKSLQDYGGYVVDTSGTNGTSANIRGDQYINPDAEKQVSEDMKTLYPLLRVVTNNAQDQETSGGGTARDTICATKPKSSVTTSDKNNPKQNIDNPKDNNNSVTDDRKRDDFGWVATSSSFTPMADADAAALVVPMTENRKEDNASASSVVGDANHYVPTSDELNTFLTSEKNANGDLPAEFNPYAQYVTGNFSGTTDEIIQWAATKWGIPIDWIRAQAVVESNWHATQVGDSTSVKDASKYPEYSRKDGNNVFQSLGILGLRWDHPDENRAGTGTEPLRWKSTAFNVDFALATERFYFDNPGGKRSTWGDDYKPNDNWLSLAGWYSPYPWNNSGQQKYAEGVKKVLEAKQWTKPDFPPAEPVGGS